MAGATRVQVGSASRQDVARAAPAAPRVAPPELRAVDALPDALFAALLAAGALGLVALSDPWIASLVDLALWEFPIQAGVSFAILCALSVRGFGRPWLMLLSALFGWGWSAGSFYWHELSGATSDQAWHLIIATSTVFAARWSVAWRQVPASVGLDPPGFVAAFAPLLQSALFYVALLGALLFVAAVVPVVFDVDVHMADSAPRLSVLAAAYGVRSIVCLPPLARRIRRRLERLDRGADPAAGGARATDDTP